jgi:hypothetical protein
VRLVPLVASFFCLRLLAESLLLDLCCWIVVVGSLLRIIVVAAKDRSEGGAVGRGFGGCEAGDGIGRGRRGAGEDRGVHTKQIASLPALANL